MKGPVVESAANIRKLNIGDGKVCGFPSTRVKSVKEFIKDIMRHKARCPRE